MGLGPRLINPDMFSVASGQASRRIRKLAHRPVDWSKMPIRSEEATKSTDASLKLPPLANQAKLTAAAAAAVPSQIVANKLVRRIAHIPAFEAIYVAEHEGIFDVWVIGNNVSKDEEYALYDAERTFILNNPDRHIELHWRDRRDRPLVDVISTDYFDVTISLVDRHERKNA